MIIHDFKSENNKEIKNYFDFLASKNKLDYQSQNDYIDNLIEENSGSGEI